MFAIPCFVYTFYAIVVDPVSEQIHVGASDTVHTTLDDEIQNGLKQCRLWESPISIDITLDVGCAYGLAARYVYVSLVRESVDGGYIELYDIGVYMIGKNLH